LQHEEFVTVKQLSTHEITHGGVQAVRHPRLDRDVHGQTCIRYLRFGQPVELDHLELGRISYGRHVPAVPNHPAHLIISALDRDTLEWKTIREVDLPVEPEIMGEGLSQDTPIKEMEAHFARIRSAPPHVIAMDGLRTDHLRVVCDREHPVWPNHGECNGGVHNVPFGILNALSAHGEALGDGKREFHALPVLTRGEIRPEAPGGMRLHDRPDMLLFEGEKLSIGFSLTRPMLMHLGWDALGGGQAMDNRLLVSRKRLPHFTTGGVSGPVLRTLEADYPAPLWTGTVSVEGNRVLYQDLHVIDGLHLDAVFTVERDRFRLDLHQRCEKDMPVLEAEAWRLAWDLTQGITGMAAPPTLRSGRNGDVELPGMWATDGVGCLSCSRVKGEVGDSRLHVESYRSASSVTGGFVFGEHPGATAAQVIPAGERQDAIEFAVSNLSPLGAEETSEGSVGLRRHWATVFSCFRPEFRGFSNHSASTNCHLSQGPPLEIVAHTKKTDQGIDPLDLARFTLERALLDGGGYGYHRNLYLDTDGVLLSGAGRIHQAEPDAAWLQRIEPGLVEAAQRMLDQIGADGLLICKDLSGDAGSYRWSSNSMDVVGFGHIDGYVNAWAYRAFRNAAAMFDEIPHQKDLAARCRDAATRLHAGYAPALVNPATGWVSGWRSRDGKVHDYAFTWVNGVALAFGLLDEQAARNALLGLESLREEAGPANARMGLPCNLLPIPDEDQMLGRILDQLQPTFETYTDGSLSGWPATYYLRALSIHGLKEKSAKLAREMTEGYGAGVFNGGNGAGHEFRSWEGLPTGYEGTLIGCFGPVYGIAIEEGVLTPSEPEWWPKNG
jgi:hypothetical protein